MANHWDIDAAFPDQHITITPSDTDDLFRPMIIYALTDGDITIVDKQDVAITYTVTAGWVSPLRAKRVNDTGTDADVVGLY